MSDKPDEERSEIDENREWWRMFWARREAVQRASRRESGAWDDE